MHRWHRLQYNVGGIVGEPGEGPDPLNEFAINRYPVEDAEWSHTVAPKGGFIVRFGE